MDGQGIRSLPLEQDYSNAFRTFRPFSLDLASISRSFFHRIIAVPSLSSFLTVEICEKWDSKIRRPRIVGTFVKEDS